MPKSTDLETIRRELTSQQQDWKKTWTDESCKSLLFKAALKYLCRLNPFLNGEESEHRLHGYITRLFIPKKLHLITDLDFRYLKNTLLCIAADTLV